MAEPTSDPHRSTTGGRPPQLSTALRTFAQDDPGSWHHLREAAQLLDAAGFDRIVVSDHVVFGEDLAAYGRPELGGQAGGRQPTDPDGHWLEPMTTLAVLAGLTQRIRLGTNILLAALRRPVVLAKSAATLDVLSGGRLDLGVGVGWQQAEYDAAGLDFHRRGRLLDLTLEACQALWRDRVAELDHPDLRFGRTHMMPKPRQPGGVPIWVSGTVNPRVARRLARFGRGWIPWGPAAADPTTAIPRMREAVEAAGGDADGLQVAGSLRAVRGDDGSIDLAATMAPVPALVRAGVTDVRVQLAPGDMDLARLEPVVAAFRDRVAKG
jgi:probable F420-dependent oxidoreductase